MVDTLDYQLLSKEEDEFSNLRCDCDNTVRSRQNGHHESHWQVKTSMVWVVGSCFVLAVITALAATMSLWYRNPRDMLNYSPASAVVQYHKVVYPDAAKHKTPFMGDPSPELDARWVADYDLISRIPKWQADHLDPRSDEMSDDPGYYPVMLDIFHSLHCLNEIRMMLNPDYYGEAHLRHNTTADRAKVHLDHCLEHIRLALWCNADISPIPFQDKKGPFGLTAVHGYSHTCRDKDAILDWARANQVKGMF